MGCYLWWAGPVTLCMAYNKSIRMRFLTYGVIRPPGRPLGWLSHLLLGFKGLLFHQLNPFKFLVILYVHLFVFLAIDVLLFRLTNSLAYKYQSENHQRQNDQKPEDYNYYGWLIYTVAFYQLRAPCVACNTSISCICWFVTILILLLLWTLRVILVCN